MQELEEVSKELLKVLQSDWTDNLLRRSLDKQSRMDDRLLATQATATQLVRELAAAEEKVAQTLLDQEGKRQRCLQKLQNLEEELIRAQEAGADLQTTTKYPFLSHPVISLHCPTALRLELEELREESRRLDEDMEREGDAVPATAYVTQLYYKISRIDWDYEAEPAHIKGIHYGPDIAQPIDIDGSRHSRCFVSDYLWSLVPTEW
ncbi:SPC24 protein, partial [Eurystomus gularis]|nr:SPC24 protein [Eurystomus gularis]